MWLSLGCLMIVSIAGCNRTLESQVNLVTDQDKELAGPIVSAFYRAEQGAVQPEIRTIGSGTDLDLQQADDVLWTRNVLALEQLSQQGKLQAIRWAPDRLIATQFASPDQTWQAFAASAMVIIVHKDLDTETKRSIQSLESLADAKWQHRCGIAHPAKSVASLIALAVIANSNPGSATESWLQRVADTATVLSGDLAVITQVDRGELDWGVVSSDIAAERLEPTARFELIFPDQQSTQMGTLLIPHCVAVKAEAAHPYAAARLANYLASPKTAERLAMGEQSLIPLSTMAEVRPRILQDQPVRWAQVDYKSLDDACHRVNQVFAKVSSAKSAE